MTTGHVTLEQPVQLVTLLLVRDLSGHPVADGPPRLSDLNGVSHLNVHGESAMVGRLWRTYVDAWYSSMELPRNVTSIFSGLGGQESTINDWLSRHQPTRVLTTRQGRKAFRAACRAEGVLIGSGKVGILPVAGFWALWLDERTLLVSEELRLSGSSYERMLIAPRN